MRLLIVGSLDGHIATAGKIALDRGAKVAHVDDLESAMATLRSGNGADLLMVDVALDVEWLVKSLEGERFSLPVVACGIKATPEQAAAAIRAGAKEYVPLPPDPELIAAVLAAVTEETTSFICADPVMEQVIRLAEQVASSDASVMITGESGTGKEVMARYIHGKSKRAANAFVSVNCAAIPENLLESELFGHEKGAFTGALARRIGKFEEANGGTLLLDEITEMHPRLQAKLLRAIQEREIDRVGGTTPIKVNIRLLATSNRDMEEAIREGQFREDLYFRLNVVGLGLPALRERPQDIPTLAVHFLKKYAESNGVPQPNLSQEALKIIRAHPWRGNVRELENAMHRAVLLANDNVVGPEAVLLYGARPATAQPIAPQAAAVQGYQQNSAAAAQAYGQPAQPEGAYGSQPLASGYGQPAAPVVPQQPAPAAFETPQASPAWEEPSSPAQPAAADDSTAGGTSMVGKTVAEVEKELIIDTLEHCLGNRTHAANILGISIRTLRNKLKIYSETGVNVPMPGSDMARG
ncbi:sigma 54-interacting transcriptional regulator [Rhodovibrionaceae bacterium A322]